MIRGTAVDQPPLPARRVWDFDAAKPAGLVAWYFTAGRDSIAGVKAIDYGGTRGVRDPFVLEEVHQKFAFVARACGVVSDQEQGILILAYELGRSDTQIATRLGATRRTVCRIRNGAVRKIKAEAQRFGLMGPDDVENVRER